MNPESRESPICTYCDLPAATKDHIPPAVLFARPRPANLITVDACPDCNGSFSKDDEYFHLANTNGIDPSQFPAEFQVSLNAIGKLARPEKRGFAISMLRSLRQLSLQTKAGIYLGEGAGLHIDMTRIRRVIDRVARGLFRHHTQIRLPKAADVWSLQVGLGAATDSDCVQQVQTLGSWVRGADPYEIGGAVFRYWYRLVDDDRLGSVWSLSFYDRFEFLAATASENGAEQPGTSVTD
jgi:hypothetical protein